MFDFKFEGEKAVVKVEEILGKYFIIIKKDSDIDSDTHCYINRNGRVSLDNITFDYFQDAFNILIGTICDPVKIEIKRNNFGSYYIWTQQNYDLCGYLCQDLFIRDNCRNGWYSSFEEAANTVLRAINE